jgi:UDP-2-acetamido-2,6-beta-L-arabino-hexul-4-ose reductase
MNVVVTGGHGFLGWHLACRLRSLPGVATVRLRRDEFSDADKLADRVAAADVIVHAAGVNRAESDHLVRSGNVRLANDLALALRRRGSPVRIVYANSIQSEKDNPYGAGKAEAAEILANAVYDVGGSLANILLPNIFGEHGRPHYNSFVSTFCELLAHGDEPAVIVDRAVPLLHAQSAAEIMIQAMAGSTSAVYRPACAEHRVSDVLALLRSFRDTYSRGDIPDLTDPFSVDLFNTYRSHVFPHGYPINLMPHADERGLLFETGRTHGGTGQSYFSSTAPGKTRGEHYHLRKVERFVVVRGEAEIELRRLFHDDVVIFRLSGRRPALVDMPTMWAHNIRNVGETELLTLFWSNQLLDRDNPDQFPELVKVTKR